MRFFLLFMIFLLAFSGCGRNEKGSENEILESQKENESTVAAESEELQATDEKMTLSFSYATDTDMGFGEIIEIN